MNGPAGTGSPVRGGTIHRTISLLDRALRQLGAEVDPAAVEHIGVLVNRAMSAQQRSFHTPEHIFDLADPTDPHVTLAALFHDVVYFQVDHGFSREIDELLEPYIEVEASEVRVSRNIAPDDRAFHGCAAVFGVQPGSVLHPFGGLNEFLSALVMDLLLEGTVGDVDLLIATASIEATIPFRGANAEGVRPPELLASRLEQTNAAFGLGLSDSELRDAINAAVRFANRDVHNFAEEDVAHFLDNTWKLLPESNPSLRFSGIYSIRSYGTALHKMHGFLSMLKAETVFHRYGDVPDAAEYTSLLERTTRNLRISCRYLGIKLVSAALLDALASLTGGDAPVALFMGDLDPSDNDAQLAAHLPDQAGRCQRIDSESDDLYRLLAHGRAGDSRFDLRNSPLSLFIYRCLNDDNLDSAIRSASSLFRGEESPRGFLDGLPVELVDAVAGAVGELAFTRQAALNNLRDDLTAAG